jgi:hypothetical protein
MLNKVKLSKMKSNKCLLLGIMTFLITFASCDVKFDQGIGESTEQYTQRIQTEEANRRLSEGITDFGNGVYYFPYLRSTFAKNLSDFIANHPELEYVNSTGDGTRYGMRTGGIEQGYFVVFHKKPSAEK